MRLLHADARDPEPLGAYATVVSAYCARFGDRRPRRVAHVHGPHTGAVRPGGLFVTSALRRCRSYLVGGKPFPSADVDERDVLHALEASFGRRSSTVELREVPEHAARTGIRRDRARVSACASLTPRRRRCGRTSSPPPRRPSVERPRAAAVCGFARWLSHKGVAGGCPSSPFQVFYRLPDGWMVLKPPSKNTSGGRSSP